MKSFKFNIEGRSYETTIEELGNGKVEVKVNGKSYTVEVENQTTAPKVTKTPTIDKPTPAPAPASPAPATTKVNNDAPVNGKKVVSPLPGSIIKVLVTEGQNVKKGDTLLTLESMKMENSVQAEWDGVVQKINVTAGQNVMQDDLLLIIQ